MPPPSVAEVPPPPPADEKPAATAPQVGPLMLSHITTNWRELVTRAGGVNKNMPALLNMGKPLAVEEETAVIGFDYPIFKDKFDNTTGAVELLSDILTELVGRPCRVRGVVTSDYDVSVDEDQFRALAEELGGVVKKDEK